MMNIKDAVRCHKIVDYFYCAERSRLSVLYDLEPPVNDEMETGLKVHEWLDSRPRSVEENRLFKAVMESARLLDGVYILGHIDDLAVLEEKRVQLIEYKTVGKTDLKPWKTALAKFQLQIYAWIVEPKLADLGYHLSHTHKVIYLTRTGVYLRKLAVEHDPYCVERKIKEIFEFWRKGEPLIPPMGWKCKLCPQTFKEKCRVRSEDFRGGGG